MRCCSIGRKTFLHFNGALIVFYDELPVFRNGTHKKSFLMFISCLAKKSRLTGRARNHPESFRDGDPKRCFLPL